MDEFVLHLREEHRVKLMCDYAYVCKYGELALVAPKVWLNVLREHEELLPDGLVVQWVELPNDQVEFQEGSE
jgi:hypothetical protein